MQKLFTAALLLFLSLSTLAVADDMDIRKSQGIDQVNLVDLIPTPAKADVSPDIIIKAMFDVELDQHHIKKNDITLKQLSNKKKKIEGSVTYNIEDNAVIFTPYKPLEEGIYEVNIKA